MTKAKGSNQSQDIYSTLRSMINGLEILPGTRVTENQLAEYFSVSRTPIRQALQKLENDNLLTIKPKQGCFIRNIDLPLISHYYDVRVTLENMVLSELTKHNARDGLEDLKRQWDPAQHHFGLVVTDQLKHAEEAFHLNLSGLSNNRVLEDYIADINHKIRCVRLLGWPDEKSVTNTYNEHFRICELLLAGDLSTAQAEMTVHIRKSQEQANQLTYNQLYNNRSVIQFD